MRLKSPSHPMPTAKARRATSGSAGRGYKDTKACPSHSRISSHGAPGPPPLSPAVSQPALFPWRDLDQHRFWVGAPAPGEPDTPQPARYHEQRRTECKEYFIDAELPVADTAWSV